MGVVKRTDRGRPYVTTNLSLHPERDAAIIALLDRIGQSGGVVAVLEAGLASGYPCCELTSDVRYVRFVLDPCRNKRLLSLLHDETPRRFLAARIVDILRFSMDNEGLR